MEDKNIDFCCREVLCVMQMDLTSIIQKYTSKCLILKKKHVNVIIKK